MVLLSYDLILLLKSNMEFNPTWSSSTRQDGHFMSTVSGRKHLYAVTIYRYTVAIISVIQAILLMLTWGCWLP